MSVSNGTARLVPAGRELPWFSPFLTFGFSNISSSYLRSNSQVKLFFLNLEARLRFCSISASNLPAITAWCSTTSDNYTIREPCCLSAHCWNEESSFSAATSIKQTQTKAPVSTESVECIFICWSPVKAKVKGGRQHLQSFELGALASVCGPATGSKSSSSVKTPPSMSQLLFALSRFSLSHHP